MYDGTGKKNRARFDFLSVALFGSSLLTLKLRLYFSGAFVFAKVAYFSPVLVFLGAGAILRRELLKIGLLRGEMTYPLLSRYLRRM